MCKQLGDTLVRAKDLYMHVPVKALVIHTLKTLQVCCCDSNTHRIRFSSVLTSLPKMSLLS